MKPTIKKCETDTTVVDQHLNTAYDIVKEVRDNLYWLRDLVNLLGPKLDHNILTNRELINQHPIEAIDGLEDALNGKQTKLISQTNIKSINGESVLGSGNINTRKPSVVISETAPQIVQQDTEGGYFWYNSTEDSMYLLDEVNGNWEWVFQYSTNTPEVSFPEVTQDLDMKGFKILNLPAPSSSKEPVRLQDFAGLLAKAGSGVKVVPHTTASLTVGEPQGNNHYLVNTQQPCKVLVRRPNGFILGQQSSIIYFTQLGDGHVDLEPDIGVVFVYPEGYQPNTFSKGATIAIESISNSSWLLVGNLGFE